MTQVHIKKEIYKLSERNKIINRIILLIEEKNNFLLIGHQQPDEDCISSLVSMALLIKKFNKEVTIFIKDEVPEQISYLENICVYNKITLTSDSDKIAASIDCIVVLDTPKPDQIAAEPLVLDMVLSHKLPIIEIDHHLSADSNLIGHPEVSLVTRATSTCELIAILCTKISLKPDVLQRNGITELFSRNLVLAMLTGIIGDTWFGLTAKKSRDRFFYNLFTQKFSDVLREKAHVNTHNYVSMIDIFRSLQSLSPEERNLYQKLLSKARYKGNTGYVGLDQYESHSLLASTNYALFVKVIKAVTNFLAEKSGRFGLTFFYDEPDSGGLVQFRIRLSKNVNDIDLRTVLTEFKISDGGGHNGAIGFRLSQNDFTDPKAFVQKLLASLSKL